MLKVRDIMTRDLVTVNDRMTLRDATEVLVTHRVSGVPVVAGDRVVGVLSMSDILGFAAVSPGVPTDRAEQDWDDMTEPGEWVEGVDAPAAYFTDMWSDAGADVAERFRQSESPEWDLLEEHTVEEVMTRVVYTVPPGAAVTQAADFMKRADVHRLLVTDEATLVGVVTTMDVTRAVAERRLDAPSYIVSPKRAARSTAS